MKTIVIYESGTGFTAKYAAWIAGELQCDARELKKVSAEEVKDYDTVIFGGWVMGNGIVGLDKIRAMNIKSLVIYAVGASMQGEDVASAIRQQNQLADEPFFYFQGGINFEKMGFVKKGILKMVRKSIAKKESKTEQDIFMEQALSGNCDYSNRQSVGVLVEYVKGKQNVAT